MNFVRLKNNFLSALNGLRIIWMTEQNFKIEIIFALLTIVLAFILKISLLEKAILLIAISLILFAEIINTNLEKCFDIIHPQFSGKVKCVKDTMAASILILCIAALFIGCLIFIPHLIS
jgi:diacylglycerol kinase